MTSGGDTGERNDIPELAAAVDELRALLQAFDDVRPADMILVRTCTEAHDWVAAGAALGFPADKSRNWIRYTFAANWGIKEDLLIAARTLEAKLTRHRDRPSFHRRKQVSGFGLVALKDAQSPTCLDQGGRVWCPCNS